MYSSLWQVSEATAAYYINNNWYYRSTASAYFNILDLDNCATVFSLNMLGSSKNDSWDIQFKECLDLATDYFPNDSTDSDNVLLSIDCQKYKAIIPFTNSVGCNMDCMLSHHYKIENYYVHLHGLQCHDVRKVIDLLKLIPLESVHIGFFNGSSPSHCHSTSTVTLGKYYFL